ncbi:MULTISPECIES: hypothetical protein [unclassified Sphingomonas]|nr:MULTISPECIES: hypothetical protein [unclassified Sphingomonas]
MNREQELAALREKLAARQDRPGFAANVEAIKQRIAELEAQNGD